MMPSRRSRHQGQLLVPIVQRLCHRNGSGWAAAIRSAGTAPCIRAKSTLPVSRFPAVPCRTAAGKLQNWTASASKLCGSPCRSTSCRLASRIALSSALDVKTVGWTSPFWNRKANLQEVACASASGASTSFAWCAVRPGMSQSPALTARAASCEWQRGARHFHQTWRKWPLPGRKKYGSSQCGKLSWHCLCAKPLPPSMICAIILTACIARTSSVA
mmetsp:Transcript_40043/g.95633  ORF Transcript_40043/g.95633 Transcript_40043/m.95633 type:complete len:216 (-) Transcript_40043:710-1357(-)